MSTPPPNASTTAPANAERGAAKIPGALLRYRVLAWVTGLWLLLLVVELIVKYGAGVNSLDFVPYVHGWVYFVYLIMAVDLGIKARWAPVKLIVTMIAGTIPFLSFYVEHIRTREVKARYGLH